MAGLHSPVWTLAPTPKAHHRFRPTQYGRVSRTHAGLVATPLGPLQAEDPLQNAHPPPGR